MWTCGVWDTCDTQEMAIGSKSLNARGEVKTVGESLGSVSEELPTK